jgi:hypothetical protein
MVSEGRLVFGICMCVREMQTYKRSIRDLAAFSWTVIYLGYTTAPDKIHVVPSASAT